MRASGELVFRAPASQRVPWELFKSSWTNQPTYQVTFVRKGKNGPLFVEVRRFTSSKGVKK